MSKSVSILFRWTQSLKGASNPEAQNDVVFELANLLMNYAFWHMKHAAMVSAKADIGESNRFVFTMHQTTKHVFKIWTRPKKFTPA